MIFNDIVTLLLAIAVSAAWLIGLRLYERSARAKLGPEVISFSLFQRWAIVTQYVLLGLALALPVLAAYVAIKRNHSFGEIWIALVRTTWLLSVVYGLRRSSKLLIGTNGMAIGQLGVVEWDRIESITWDRDIGQQQWGMTIELTTAGRRQSKRLYVQRASKGEMEGVIQRLRVGAGHAGNG